MAFSGSPKVLKGAIVGIDLFNPLASVIVFQYNPDTMTRTLRAQGSGEGGARSEAMRLKGAPIETIKLDVEIDATDQLETGGGLATSLGIYPQLSALEMLLYPKSALVIANTEEAYDVSLNPIRAKASLGLRVLSYNDLSLTNPGYYLFLTHQIVKETLATIGSVGNIGAVAGGNVSVF